MTIHSYVVNCVNCEDNLVYAGMQFENVSIASAIDSFCMARNLGSLPCTMTGNGGGVMLQVEDDQGNKFPIRCFDPT